MCLRVSRVDFHMPAAELGIVSRESMHHLYFPACPVEGPIDPPVPFGHMDTEGAIPNKCGHCRFMFEGECKRSMNEVQRYLHLDYGPCGIDGPTDPVTYEDQFVRSKVEIPRKCSRCRFLFHDSIYGFECRKDEQKWGNCYRGLDWGAWSPDRIYLDLPHPKRTTKALVDYAYDENLVGFISEYRKINPGVSIAQARDDFARFRELITQRAQSGNPPGK